MPGRPLPRGHMTATADIAISGGTLLTMDDNLRVIENPLITIHGDRITAVDQVGPAIHPLAALKTIDATGTIILPGLINTHTHVPMVCFRGIADDLPLMEWLNKRIFPLEMKFIDKEFVYWGAMLACAEMILSGTTLFCDGYFYPGRTARAAMEAGLRVTLGLGFFDWEEDSLAAATRNANLARQFIDKWLHISPLVTPAVFPHAPYTCRPETMVAVKSVADDYNVPFITHLSETQDEVALIKERYGSTPVRLLHSLGVLNSRTIAVHCNWLDEEEMDILAQTDTRVSHNAESGMKLASGICPVPELLRRGVSVGLGTDGSASNNDLDLMREMGTVALIHKHITQNPTVMDARTVLRLATKIGAQVVGKEGELGSIEVGKKADIILVDTHHPRLQPLYNPYSQLVYATGGDNVTTVICNGRILMEKRHLTTIDLDRVINEVHAIAHRIKTEANFSF